MKNPSEFALDCSGPVTRNFPASSMFAAARSALLVVEQATGRVAEANDAAGQLLGLQKSALLGSYWLGAFDQACTQQLADGCREAELKQLPLIFDVRGRDGRAPLRATITLFKVGRDTYLLVRLLPGDAPVVEPARDGTAQALDELDNTSIGFVVTNRYLQVEYANRAFLAMVRPENAEEVSGRSLARWLALTEDDLQRLREQVTGRQATVVIRTALHEGPTAGRGVELTAVAVPDAPEPCWGFTLRLLDPDAPGAAAHQPKREFAVPGSA